MTADSDSLLEALREPLEVLGSLDLTDPESARGALEERLPLDGAVMGAVEAALRKAALEGDLLDREMGGVRFGRLAKEAGGFSIDCVLSAGPGPRHRHPKGEIDLLLAVDGEPSFDGNRPGWAVYAPGSEHVPAVSGGTMLILYFLPEGQIDWL